MVIRNKDTKVLELVTLVESMTNILESRIDIFTDVFKPLFRNSSEKAKRQAVAALSRCSNVPEKTAFFIGIQPISIAAIFLITSPKISDKTLLAIAKTQGKEHIHAIFHRKDLSPNIKERLLKIQKKKMFYIARKYNPEKGLSKHTV
ncbi:hypothetical protein [Candidatus Liberibacter sp.]|uniref:hypothetical protein n=1 Tax=Candidatus Liberibacter sp. TaxID=34022 RepID=UPI0015F4F02A|nr:hypothetical protein [Candidatus Liberibacter sp.]MBA5724188.1 hypothetical protein [Candidatus Liberibacter sp.]